MSGEPIKPLDAGTLLSVGREYLGGALNELIIVGTYYCSGCAKPHIVRVASTDPKAESVVAILSLAIIDVIDTNHIIADENTISWRHGE